MKNAGKNLRSHKDWKKIEVAVKVVVHECLDPEEFEAAWAAIISTFDIGNNNWIQESYQLRERWVPGYCPGNYWARMSSTQRSEGMNRYLKGVVNIDTPLSRFVELYEFTMANLANTVHQLTFYSKNQPLPVDKTVLAEYVFQTKYTNRKFKEV